MIYKRLGDYIQPVNIRNKELAVTTLLGVSVKKVFIPSIANTVGTDFKKYKIVKKKQFVYIPDTSRRGDKIGIAMLEEYENALVSQAYSVFEIKDQNKLLSEYLMMWFRRPEFDRYARYKSHGSVREIFDWDEVCDIELPIPTIEKQQQIVAEYNSVTNRIQLNEKINTNLEATAQALYKHWFVDFEFPNEDGKPYKSSGGEMVYNEELDKEIPVGWSVENLISVCDKISSGSTPKGGKDGYHKTGISFIRSMNVYDFNFKYEELAFIDDAQASKLRNVTIKSNDILFNITGASVARCCLVPNEILPARINQHIMLIRPKSKINYYLLCNLCSKESKKQLVGVSESGSTRQAITKGDLQNFRIILPSEILLESYENKISKLFNNKNSQQSQTLQELQSLLLAKMTQVAPKNEAL
ncbi:restriction endonuclease subunit S [Zobellia uliginosa]|uniref:restriction endonuclease subunit S n=1 Tax=Zobellia uliginosa TaxID=143224 RepID=UPI001C06B643|nr:restriction endonuclease subunit S [Zobellia uliginosa]MBU2945441.1 restriction endonuclease subunit S [Zobellia uliginosa]